MATDSVYTVYMCLSLRNVLLKKYIIEQKAQSVTVIVSRSLTDPTGLVMFTRRFKMFQVSALLSSVGPNFRGHGQI